MAKRNETKEISIKLFDFESDKAEETYKAFKAEYPFKKVKENPLFLAESMGYVKAIEKVYGEFEWTKSVRLTILSLMILFKETSHQ